MKYISTAEYAEKVGRSPRTVRQKIKDGTLPAIMVGNSYAIREDEPYVDKRFKTGEYVGFRNKKRKASAKRRAAAERAKMIAEESKGKNK